jgi:2-dehydro-3-deoxyphosphogluconate aldolase/(4S)-4-hydroxy-2-oxoglutarate aldolase
MTTAGAATALARIREVGIIPVIRADSDDQALRIADALVGAGLDIVEITMTVPGAISVMRSISSRLGASVVLGAGTVTSVETVNAAVDAGCAFLVTPCLLPDVVAAARARQTPIICGALTPTEVFATHQAGADLVKVFPADALGGPAYIRALKGPFPSIDFVATGGVGVDTVGNYFKAGVAAVGVGGELISRAAVRKGDYQAIGDAARQFLDLARRARAAGQT